VQIQLKSKFLMRNTLLLPILASLTLCSFNSLALAREIDWFEDWPGDHFYADATTPAWVAIFKAAPDSGKVRQTYLISEFSRYLRQGGGVNDAGYRNWTILHYAVASGDQDLIEFLIARGASINSKLEESSWTLLHQAARGGHKQLVEFFIAQGFDIHTKDAYENSLMHLAARSGSLELIEFLHNKGLDVNEPKGDSGWSILANAVQSGNLSLIKYLIGKGAKVNGDSTAMSIAIDLKRLELVEYLLEAGADVKGDSWFLYKAAGAGQLEISKLLIAKGADVNGHLSNGETALMIATRGGFLEIVEFLVSRGADVNIRDESGQTALHEATAGENFQLLEFLINHGANINTKANFGQTPLYYAVERGDQKAVKLLLAKGAVAGSCLEALLSKAGKWNKAIIELLIANGANVNVQTSNGITMLLYALQEGKLDMAKILLNHNINVNAHTKNGMTALHYAASKGDQEIIRILIAKGANVNTRNQDGESPLHQATHAENRFVVCHLLLTQNINVNFQDRHGETVLHRVARIGDEKLLKLLLAHGADLSIRNKDRKTPLDIALQEKRPDIIQILNQHYLSQNHLGFRVHPLVLTAGLLVPISTAAILFWDRLRKQRS
jgi:ankyrin repeat protein